MRKTAIFFMLACATVCAQAQLRVLPKGNILTGALRYSQGIDQPVVPLNTGGSITISLDTIYHRDAAIHLFSPSSTGYAFAAFGTRGMKVGETSAGCLSLDGYFGLEGNINHSLVYRCTGSSGSFKFFRDVETDGVYITSDSRLKTDIAVIEPERAEDLSMLNPVSYRYKNQNSANGINANGTQNESGTRFGLIAQDVKEIYPELVKENEEGNLSVDYIGLIPLMLAKINNLQSQLDAMNGTRQAPASVNGIEGAVTFKLYQNAPNPFKSSTVIACDLPETANDATIRVYDLQGQQITVLPVGGRGHVSVTLDGGSLRPGMYIYALIADGQEIDSRRMIITE